MVKGYAAHEAGGELKPFEYELGSLGDTQVDIKIEYCGVCYSDISMLDNEWGMTQYPFIPGHEIIGIIEAVGENVKELTAGQRIGLGWNSGSCMVCEWCKSGDNNLCLSAESTIVGRYGGIATKVRAESAFVIPIPEKLDAEAAGPMFCGGITVFNPIIQYNIKATDKVGVIGIGGLGHMALQFLHAWGCEVTAFSNSSEKESDARKFGADHFVNSRNLKALEEVANSFDFIISTVHASLDWNVYLGTLRPKGRLHFVGVSPQPISIGMSNIVGGQKSISASPVGSPVTISKMLEFAVRHKIQPTIETFKFAQINDALEKLKLGNVRYRIVLKQ